MKRLFVLIVTILAIASIIAGKIHWNNKIEEIGKIQVAVAKTENKEAPKEVETIFDEKEKATKKEKVQQLSKNLPKEIVAKLEKAVEEEKPVHLVIFGSDSTLDDATGWSTLLKQELVNSYGEDIIKVTIKEIADTTSSVVIEDELYKDVIALKPDILLYEPFILYDNGKVRFEDRLENLTTVLDEFNNKLPNLTVLLQPANPLYKASFYPKEVVEFQRFVEGNKYIYLNHWKAWPDHQTDEIADYLSDGQPNESGNKVWADYLIKYFISK